MGLERYPDSSKDTYDIEANWEKFRFHLIKLGMLLRDGGLLVINVAPIYNGAFDLPQQFIDDIKKYTSIFQLTLETVFFSVINKKEKSPAGVLDSDVAGREKFIVARKVATLNKLGGIVLSLNQEPEKKDDQDEACRKFTAVKYDPSFFNPSKYTPAVQPAAIAYRT
jgi:hypothetical protein